jgi:hypothetical protein
MMMVMVAVTVMEYHSIYLLKTCSEQDVVPTLRLKQRNIIPKRQGRCERTA